MDRQKLEAIIKNHGKWLRGEGGERADLQYAYLQRADLQRAHLQRADLQGADLQYADLQYAYLQGAHLQRAHLQDADLQDADLQRADLQRADLQGAYLQGAYLRGAHLQGAHLPWFQIPQDGTLTVYKKVQDKIVKLLIPAKAKRTASLVGRKCRAEYAKVLSIEGDKPVTSDGLRQGPKTRYEVGKTVKPDSYDDDIRTECSHGIHFFLTREEAEEFNG